MKRRRTTHSDPTPARARTNSIAEVLEHLSRDQVVALLATRVYGLSDLQTSRRFDIPVNQIDRLSRTAMAWIRHPKRLVAGFEAELDGVVATSADLQILLQKFGLAELEAAPQCAHCKRPVLALHLYRPAVGRPRKYCSNACRQAAYRARKTGSCGGEDAAWVSR
ncbi:hypothetical protein [Streptomyces sp. NBC_01262]|uniref:hypothetical protein n=1 Tax=Streptomyces sp. NBC_01262 TaxID=2903803 RepID=UPI002E30808F|nr:hypothetical protein [Streptomyces sp. NBC_01262]